MTTDTLRTDEKHTEKACAIAVPSTTDALASIIASVKHDSQQAAKAYLEETKVPHGGE